MGIADAWIESIKRQPDEDADVGEGFARTRRAVWEIVVKDEHITKELTAFLTHTQLPAYLSPFYTFDQSWWDSLCVLRNVRIRRSAANKKFLRLEYEYSTTPTGGRMSAGQIDPALIPRP